MGSLLDFALPAPLLAVTPLPNFHMNTPGCPDPPLTLRPTQQLPDAKLTQGPTLHVRLNLFIQNIATSHTQGLFSRSPL